MFYVESVNIVPSLWISIKGSIKPSVNVEERLIIKYSFMENSAGKIESSSFRFVVVSMSDVQPERGLACRGK